MHEQLLIREWVIARLLSIPTLVALVGLHPKLQIVQIYGNQAEVGAVAPYAVVKYITARVGMTQDCEASMYFNNYYVLIYYPNGGLKSILDSRVLKHVEETLGVSPDDNSGDSIVQGCVLVRPAEGTDAVDGKAIKFIGGEIQIICRPDNG